MFRPMCYVVCGTRRSGKSNWITNQLEQNRDHHESMHWTEDEVQLLPENAFDEQLKPSDVQKHIYIECRDTLTHGVWEKIEKHCDLWTYFLVTFGNNAQLLCKKHGHMLDTTIDDLVSFENTFKMKNSKDIDAFQFVNSEVKPNGAAE